MNEQVKEEIIIDDDNLTDEEKKEIEHKEEIKGLKKKYEELNNNYIKSLEQAKPEKEAEKKDPSLEEININDIPTEKWDEILASRGYILEEKDEDGEITSKMSKNEIIRVKGRIIYEHNQEVRQKKIALRQDILDRRIEEGLFNKDLMSNVDESMQEDVKKYLKELNSNSPEAMEIAVKAVRADRAIEKNDISLLGQPEIGNILKKKTDKKERWGEKEEETRINMGISKKEWEKSREIGEEQDKR